MRHRVIVLQADDCMCAANGVLFTALAIHDPAQIDAFGAAGQPVHMAAPRLAWRRPKLRARCLNRRQWRSGLRAEILDAARAVASGWVSVIPRGCSGGRGDL